MKLLIVEDNNDIRSALKMGLENAGYTVDEAADGSEGLSLAQINEYDLILLDINLPEKDGYAIVSRIRDENTEVPVIALTARDALNDKLHGFDSGFDDYVTKPFELAELLARVNAFIRRSKPNKDLVLVYKSIELDPAKRWVKVDKDEVTLTKIEFNMLEYLLRNKGMVVNSAELIEHIWGEDADLLDPPIRSHIKNLRKKIGDKDLTIIQTIPGVGYKISG